MSEAFDRTMEKVASDVGAGPLAPSSESGPTPMPESLELRKGDEVRAKLGIEESAFDRTMRAVTDRVLRQEKQALRVDPAEASERAQIKANREAREASERSGKQLPHSITNGVPGKIQDTVEMAFRRVARREAEAEAVRLPPDPRRSFDETMREVLKWNALPMDERRVIKGGYDEMAGQRKAAEGLGMSLAEATAAVTEKRIANNDVLTPLLTEFEQDPKATWLKFGQEHGLVPRMTAEQHQAHQARAEAARESALMRGVQSVVDDFAMRVPDFAEHEGVMQAAIEQGLVQRTGHVATDLHAAYNFARSGGVTSVIGQYAASRPDFDRLMPTMEWAITNGWVARSGNVLRDLDAAYTFARSRYAA